MLWHITLSTDERFPLALDEQRRRAVVRLLARLAGARIVLYCVADDHIHLVVSGDRRQVGLLGRSLRVALSRQGGPPVARARLRPVENRSHLLWLVRYLLTQVTHHGIAGSHPGLWTGSCFQDLIGARALPGLCPSIGQVLPRLHKSELCGIVGLPSSITPAGDAAIRAAGAVRLVDLVACVLAQGPLFPDDDPPPRAVRHAAANVSTLVSISDREMAWALRVTARTVRRLAEPAQPAPVVSAVRMRLALENLVSGAPSRPHGEGQSARHDRSLQSGPRPIQPGRGPEASACSVRRS